MTENNDKNNSVSHRYDKDKNKIIEVQLTEQQISEKQRREELFSELELDYQWLKGLSDD